VSHGPALAFARDEPAGSALNSLRRRLAAVDATSAALEARCLVEAACGLDRAGLIAHADRPLGERSADKLAEFAARRFAGEPLARILGTREFWGLPFRLSPATLEPRPETETLVAAVLRHCEESFGRNHPWRDHPWRILDLGTGSGCILVSLLSELPGATAIGVDRSPEALLTARGNAEELGVGGRALWVASDWASALRGTFDIVVSNPPYIVSADIAGLAPEVRNNDPLLALDGGPDGLTCHSAIVNDVNQLMGDRGRVFLEMGAGQDAPLRALLTLRGLTEIRSYVDLSGLTRVVSAGPVKNVA
jgi:release factor glutamine methyltransferase